MKWRFCITHTCKLHLFPIVSAVRQFTRAEVSGFLHLPVRSQYGDDASVYETELTDNLSRVWNVWGQWTSHSANLFASVHQHLEVTGSPFLIIR